MVRGVKEFGRIYGGDARVRWIREMPSVASGKTPCENCHVKNGGMGRKADAKWIVPLTPAEHRELHAIGRKSFEQKYGIDLEAEAKRIHDEWMGVEF